MLVAEEKELFFAEEKICEKPQVILHRGKVSNVELAFKLLCGELLQLYRLIGLPRTAKAA